MIDIELFREKPEIIKKSEKKRYKDASNVDKVIDYDKKWRASTYKLQSLRAKRNQVSIEISQLKKKRKPTKTHILEVRKILDDIDKLEKQTEKYLKQREEFRYKIGNILDDSVPKGKDEKSNKTVRKWGKPVKAKWIKPHAEAVLDLDLAELDKASELAGARFFYLKNEAVALNFALLRLSMDILEKNGFTPFWTPYFLRKKYMAGAAELADFEEQLYKVEGEDLFLIATAEQTLASLHSNEILATETLPRKYVAYSACFRREAGAHGKDTKGLFRVHQFDKIEQFVLCAAKESKEWHEKMTKTMEEIFKALEIPYRIVNIASGEMNDNGSKKYDIECWFPSMGEYKELGSATNCTDYQARKLSIRYGHKGGEKDIIHTLNATALATERAICALLENHQEKDGSVKIPKALAKYTGFKVIKPKK